jgi:hypothetical protein
MQTPPGEGTQNMDSEDDPYRFLYITGLAAGALFAFGYWAILIIACLSGDFTFGGLLITALVSGAAWLGLLGWRRRKAAFSGGALALLLTAIGLSQYVNG